MAYSQPGGVDSHVSLVKVSAIAIETSNEVTGGVLYFIYETNQYISSKSIKHIKAIQNTAKQIKSKQSESKHIKSKQNKSKHTKTKQI